MSTTTISSSTSDDNMPTKKKKKRVVIVGAGMAGLSTAYHLCQSRSRSGSEDILQVELVEARDYIGGRVHTIKLLPGLFVDIGGQWIHEASVSHNPLVQLCQEELRDIIPAPLQDNYHVQQQRHKSEDLVVYNIRTGKRVQTSLTKDASRYFYKGMNEFELSDGNIDINTSFQDLCDSKWVYLSTQHRTGQRRGVSRSSNGSTNSGTMENHPQEEQIDDMRCVWNVCTHRTEIYEGGRLEELSVALCEMYENKGGPDKLPPNGGYHTLVNAIVHRLTTTTNDDEDDGRYSCRIRLSSPVQSITYNQCQEKEDTSSLSSSTPSNITIQLNDEDKTTLTADCCICTVPLGVLKRQAIHFNPPLPAFKQEAIDTMGMGLINKIILVFPKAFWQGHSHFGAADPKDARETWSFYDCTLPSHDYHTLMVFLGGNSARRFDRFDKNDARDSDTTVTTPPTTTTAKASQQRRVLEEEAVTQVLTVLRRIFSDATIPSPIASHVTSWGSDEYAGGAYSFAKVNSTEQTYQDMMAPVGGCLYFAGEHTSPTAHSTVHGAWETGQREAKRILSLFMDQERR